MLQNFLKIYPKTMAAQRVNGVVCVKLVYAVEQYGVFTGPFEMLVSYQPEHLAQEGKRWVIVSNTHHHGSGAFEGFFKTLEAYLDDQAQVNPLEEVRSGAKKSFDMYFPEMHCDLYKKSSEKDRQALQKPCASKWVAGFKKAISPLARTPQFKPALGMAC